MCRHADREGSADCEHLLKHLVVGVSAEEESIRGHLKKSRASTPCVNRSAELLAQDDLRSSVKSRHHVLVHDLFNLTYGHRIPKVGQLDRRAVLRQQQVLGLDVGMHEACLSQSPQCKEEMPAKVADCREQRQAAASAMSLEGREHVVLHRLEETSQVTLVLEALEKHETEKGLRAFRVQLGSLGVQMAHELHLSLQCLPLQNGCSRELDCKLPLCQVVGTAPDC
mmetsp:Transcript_108058/g.315908  ORF Transcript_108058/g.315908 Transcript_108058/m.315908 type:complete len:225 (+) Transcript_108058:425-1099(+)